jgi:hypothetical protein
MLSLSSVANNGDQQVPPAPATPVAPPTPKYSYETVIIRSKSPTDVAGIIKAQSNSLGKKGYSLKQVIVQPTISETRGNRTTQTIPYVLVFEKNG